MDLKVTIHKIKGIKHAEIVLPIEKGLYAIAGENGSGKSTIIACAACAFFKFPVEQFFGETETDSHIKFELGDNIFMFQYDKEKNNWCKKRVAGHNNDYTKILKGFFEGSLNFGNRFRDVSWWKIPSQADIKSYHKEKTSDEMREQMGEILHGNKYFYEELSYYRNRNIYKGDIFFYKKNGLFIDQFHMSTGENLLVSILSYINDKNIQRKEVPVNPYVIFLDEIEMGLHPAAVKRLVEYLSRIAEEYNYAIYLSTQSVEILHDIDPYRTFYIEREYGNETTIRAIRPCYPQKATQRLYKHIGFDRVILVEDDLARAFVERVVTQQRLKTNKLLLILPCAGSTNTIDFAKTALTYNILGTKDTISLVIDGDVEKEAKRHMNNIGLLPDVSYAFLPIPSLEKFLRNYLVVLPDINFIDLLNDYIFQPHDIRDTLNEYKKQLKSSDNDGKILYEKFILPRLKQMNKDRAELIDEIITYLFDVKKIETKDFITFIQKRLN